MYSLQQVGRTPETPSVALRGRARSARAGAGGAPGVVAVVLAGHQVVVLLLATWGRGPLRGRGYARLKQGETVSQGEPTAGQKHKRCSGHENGRVGAGSATADSVCQLLSPHAPSPVWLNTTSANRGGVSALDIWASESRVVRRSVMMMCCDVLWHEMDPIMMNGRPRANSMDQIQ